MGLKSSDGNVTALAGGGVARDGGWCKSRKLSLENISAKRGDNQHVQTYKARHLRLIRVVGS